MNQPITDTFDRHVATSALVLARDGDQAAHDERVRAVRAILFGAGLDLGQVARGAAHGDPQWQSRPQPSRDQVSAQCLAFLRRERLV